MNIQKLSISLIASLLVIQASAQISNLTQWTPLKDPPHAQMSGTQDSPVSVELIAGPGGPIPSGTDIGYASVNNTSFATSNFGYGFSPDSDFWIMIDFDMKFLGSSGGGLIAGFGVGEDTSGTDSVGISLITLNGVAFNTPVTGFYGVSRTNDLTSLPIAFDTAPNELINGSMSVRYFAASGTFFVGLGGLGDNDITESEQLVGLQNNWDNEFLFPSVFLRSDNLGGLAQPFSTTGEGSVVFSNFRVIEGEFARAVPEPSAFAVIMGLGSIVFVASRRRFSRS